MSKPPVDPATQPKLKITLAQINPTVGDIQNNCDKIISIFLEADQRGQDIVVTPELALTGCPLEDLAASPDLQEACNAALEKLRVSTENHHAALIVGTPYKSPDGLLDAAIIFQDGKCPGMANKRKLPHGTVLDQSRAFTPGTIRHLPLKVHGVKIGLLIGQDAESAEPTDELLSLGAELVICLHADPFHPTVLERRVREIVAQRVAESGLPFLFVNLVGGQDEVVFDGGSFGLDHAGRRFIQLPQWEEKIQDCDLGLANPPIEGEVFPDPCEEGWRGMVLALGDYVRKCGFTDVLLGLSGGLDSAVVAAVAGDALGSKHVHCVRLPGQFTSDLSNNSAAGMARIWGFSMDTVPILPVVTSAMETLREFQPEGLKKLTRENLQARARGYLLMTMSNERGWLLLSTGNKSEIAVGYATLYGDMCGGFCPLKDVFKTTVFQLARWRNKNRPAGLKGPEGMVIPQEIIDRPPSAELSEGQLDSDSLPPYPLLDGILKEMVENRRAAEDIVDLGYAPEMVAKVQRLLRISEYKRRQGAPGPKLSPRAFTGDRRVPMVNRFYPGMTAELRGEKSE